MLTENQFKSMTGLFYRVRNDNKYIIIISEFGYKLMWSDPLITGKDSFHPKGLMMKNIYRWNSSQLTDIGSYRLSEFCGEFKISPAVSGFISGV